jgi:hypothetical protein
MSDSATIRGEIPLTGGRITPGVVRVGDTVRRPSKPSSAFVARLLMDLERCGCAWAPRYLGQDELGRDILSYLPGCTPAKWIQFANEQIREAARMVRQLHELTCASDLASGTVICHNDAGPNNFVFRDNVLVGIIDFDLAAPGDPLDDVGYMAWAWCISSKPGRGTVAAQAQQVRVLADAYGADSIDRGRLLDKILERQLMNTRFWRERLAAPNDTATSPAKMLEIIEWSQREMLYTETHRRDFVTALMC